MKRLFILLPFVIFHGLIYAQELTRISSSIPDGVEVIKDITYVKYGDRNLMLDVYRPADRPEGQLPTLLVIRGGGWASGDKEGFAPIAAALALRGFATVCIEYRASDEATFPAAVKDTKSAVKWIKDNAGKYNFNPSLIGAIGGSAGAHLAMLLGVSSTARSLNPVGEPEDFRIQAVVGMATPTDLTGSAEGTEVVKWIGKPYATNEELWNSASPITYIDKNSPPMLFIHSSADNVVSYEQSLRAIDKLGEAGIYTELVLIPDAPHPFWNYEEWFESVMDKAAIFFHEQLKN